MNGGGILRIGLKLLVNDRAKFSALLIGITFAVFLMMQMTAMFAGVISRAHSMISNVGAPMWIIDPAVNIPTSAVPLPDYLLDHVRSLDGVSYAVPIFVGAGQVRLASGAFQGVSVIGLDDSSLYGRPELERGEVTDIFADNGFFVVRDAEFDKLENPTIGTTFELNDHRGVIVGIARVAASGLNGVPTLYTTFSRAIEYLPTTRFTLSYVLLMPASEAAVARIKADVAGLGYLALTREEFNQRIADFYTYKTGVGTNILIMTVISFLVGLSISGQTFYSFILENLDKFGALKAIGAKGRELVAMILFMAGFTALTGFGLGVGLVTLLIGAMRLRLPNYAAIVTPFNLALAFCMVLVIAGMSSFFAVRRVLRVEPFDIFRS